MVYHLHGFFCTTEGEFGGIRRVFGDEEVEDIDRLSKLRRYCGRRAGCLWRGVDNRESSP